MAFWNFIKPCSESLMNWNAARDKVKESSANNANPFPFLQGQEKQRNRKREIEPIDQLWLFSTTVRLGLLERDLAHRFGVAVSTFSDVFITWANYLYIMLGSLPVWPSRDKIKQHIPDSFKGRYENVRGILDCTELKCELPKDYQKHSELVEKSNFYQLIEIGYQYLADKGFEIHELMALKGASLYIPPKRFSATDQFAQSQCFETMSIANVHIHVERAIKRVKAWHIFNQASFQLWVYKSDLDCLCFASQFSISNYFRLKQQSFEIS